MNLLDIPVIYINLDNDTDRRYRIESELKKAGFKTIIRYSAIESAITNKGCAGSHHEALLEIEPPFILLEDDCVIKNLVTHINVPKDADAIYLGVSSWGRMNSHSGPCVQYEKTVDQSLYRVYNMLGAHAILYLTPEYVSVCSKIAFYFYNNTDHHDIGFAEIQKYYNVYSLTYPLFYQTSSNGTEEHLTYYPSQEFITYNKHYWYPLAAK
jgi:hypothetical protein